MYKKGDKVIFKVGEESFEYNVIENDHCIWFLSKLKDTNSIIFKKLNITDKFKFVRDISKYATDDKSKAFPEIAYPNETEINKVIDALLEKCDEYNKQLNNKTLSSHYKDDDQIVFKLPNIEYIYHISRSASDRWFLTNNAGLNSRILDDLNIMDKMQFCRDVSGCETRIGNFPEIICSDSTGITKVINKLMEMCEEKMKESLKTEKKISTETTLQKPIFKEGDYVRVIFKEDVKNGSHYRFGFTPEMFRYCGDIYIVYKVSNAYSEAGSEPDDGMLYNLKTIAGTVLPYNFASSMLISTGIIPSQLPFLDTLQREYPLVSSDCIQKTTDSETKVVLEKSTPEYKLKFTN